MTDDMTLRSKFDAKNLNSAAKTVKERSDDTNEMHSRLIRITLRSLQRLPFESVSTDCEVTRERGYFGTISP